MSVALSVVGPRVCLMTATAGDQVDDQRVEDRPRNRPLPESTADPEAVLGTLSPSRASDFKSGPLLYRFRTVDRLPERPSPDAVRGTVVHKVLEDLFDLPGHERTPERAAAMVESAWAQVLETEPAMAEMFTADAAAGLDLSDWLESC